MKTLFILLIFFSLVFGIKSLNEKDSTEEKKVANDVNLIFSKMYKHSFDTL